MNKYLIIVISLFISLGSIAQKEYDFRKVKWGYSIKQVESAEGKKYDDISKDGSDITIYYKVNFCGYNAVLLYIFNKNKLISSAFYLTDRHSSKNTYLRDYASLVKIYKDKYGVPKEEFTNWYDDLFKQDPSNWGVALSLGHMGKYTSFETKSTRILLLISGDNNIIKTIVSYTSLYYEKLKKQNDSEKYNSQI